MKTLRLLTMFSKTAPAALLLAQLHAPSVKPAFYISLQPETQKLKLGTKVEVKAYFQSTTETPELADREASIGCSPYLVKIKNQNGEEPEKTEYYRHHLGEFLPGDGPDQSGGSCDVLTVRAGGSVVLVYDLSAYYKLINLGKYEVSLEVDDVVPDPTRGQGMTKSYPVSSNTVRFELVKAK